MEAQEYYKIFMTNALCCYSKKAVCIAEKKQKGIKLRSNEELELKILYLLVTTFCSYNLNCISAEDYDKVYQAINNICKFCNCSKTIAQ